MIIDKKKAEKKIKKERKTREWRPMQKSILPGAIILALFAAVIVYVVMLNAEKSALSDYEKGIILTTLQEIPEGLLIVEENSGNYLVEKEIDKKLIPEAALRNREQAIGLIAVSKIDKGSMLTQGMFEDINKITGNMKEPVVAGFKAEDLYQVAGGMLRAGDRIHIYIVNEETKEVSLVWQEAFVQQVFDASGNAIENEDQTTAAQRINIFLEKASTEQFYAELAAGSLRATKVWD